MDLSSLKDAQGARQNRKRVGRGAGSGMGKTASRGVKGQKSRSGVAIKGFEGGQMPIYRRVPKRGFVNIFRKQYAAVTLERLQQAVDSQKLDAKKTVNAEVLVAAGVVRPSKLGLGVKILASGAITSPLTLEVSKASAAAVAAIEKAGGKITVSESSAA